MCRICGKLGVLPSSLAIPQCYNRLDAPPAGGGYAEVWKGNYQGLHVAVKVLRIYSKADLLKIKRVGRRYRVLSAYLGRLTIILL